MKTKLSLLSLLTLAGISALNAGQPVAAASQPNWMLKWALDNGRDALQGMGEFAAERARDVQRMYEAKMEENRKNRERLERTVNDKNATPAAIALAQRQLEKLADAEAATKANFEKIQMAGLESVQKLQDAAVEIGKDFMLGESERKKAAEVAAVQAHFAKDEAVEKAKISAANELLKIDKYTAYLKDPKNAGTLALFALGTAGGFFAAKHGAALAADLIKHYYRNPTLAQETSLLTLEEKIAQTVYGKKIVSASIKDVILEPVLEAQIAILADSVQNAAQAGNFLPNVLFYGPPGTGKTMIAQRIARSSGIDYIYFAASALEQFSIEEALIKLTELFEYAKKSGNKIMIIIDEAENLFTDRTKELPEKTAKMLTHLLTYSGTESRDYMLVLLTNLPSMLDTAVLSRMDNQIEIAAPALEQRIGILKKYINDYLITNIQEERESTLLSRVGSWFITQPDTINPIVIEDSALSDDAIAAIAERLNGFVGRDISKLVLGIQAAANAALANDTGKKITTVSMIEEVVAQKIKQHKVKMQGFAKKA